MRVRLTQIIDYWVGVPMAALFSVLHGVRCLFCRPRTAAPRKILFMEISEMGSAILAYSSLVQARQIIGSDELYFLVFEKNRESVELLNVIPREHILTIPDDSFLSFAGGAFHALRHLRKLGIDTIVDMELFSRFTALFSFASGAVNRVGFHNYTAEGLYRGTFLTHRVFYNPHQHMSKNFLALVFALTAEREETPLLKRNVEGALLPLPKYEVSEQQRGAVMRMLRDAGCVPTAETCLVIFNPDPGEALPIRGWPLDSYVKLARSLTQGESRHCGSGHRTSALQGVRKGVAKRTASWAVCRLDGQDAEPCRSGDSFYDE